MSDTVFGLPEPHFVDRDPQAVTAEMIADYERMAGRTLMPAQVERLLIDLLAYREALIRIAIQEAAKQNLLAYAAGAQLDHLGLLVDTVRLPARPARTLLRFTLAAPAGADTAIPAGTRARPARAPQILFATTVAAVIPAGQTAVEVAAEAVAAGSDGNGFLAGQLDSLVAPLPGVTVANVTATAGGAAVEDDERLRLRIRAAPRAFSVAGPEGAYAWWAMTAHQDIVDVAVLSPAPAEVEVYPLMRGGLPEVLALVAAAVSDETRRPLADRVTVLPPVRVAYAIEVAVTVYRTADPVAVRAAVQAAVTALAAAWRGRLGADIVPSQIVAAAQAVAGVYQVALVQPAWRAVAAQEWADCTALTVTVAGVADG